MRDCAGRVPQHAPWGRHPSKGLDLEECGYGMRRAGTNLTELNCSAEGCAWRKEVMEGGGERAGRETLERISLRRRGRCYQAEHLRRGRGLGQGLLAC